MNMNKIVLCILFLCVLNVPAFAYIDPGSVSYFFQYIIAGLFGSIYFFRNQIKGIFVFFKNIFFK